MPITVVIDDTDTFIDYVGDWHVSGSRIEYNNTLHGTAAAGAQAIYKFKGKNRCGSISVILNNDLGSSISVLGTLARGAAATPTTSFSIDNSGASVYKGHPSETGPLSQQLFYTSSRLDPSKEHTLVITVISSAGNAFWLDYFQVVQEDATTSVTSPPDAPHIPSSPGSQPTSERPASLITAIPQQSNSPTSLTVIQLPPGSSSTLSSAISTANATAESVHTTSKELGSFLPSSTIESDRTVTAVPTGTTVTTAIQTQSSAQSSPSRSNGRIIGIAVGIAVGALSLSILVVVLFRVYRRKIRTRRSMLLSTGAMTTPTSETSSRRYDTVFTIPGPRQFAGYVVRGGLSKEKSTNRPHNRERSESQPPAYRSDDPGDIASPERAFFGP